MQTNTFNIGLIIQNKFAQLKLAISLFHICTLYFVYFARIRDNPNRAKFYMLNISCLLVRMVYTETPNVKKYTKC